MKSLALFPMLLVLPLDAEQSCHRIDAVRGEVQFEIVQAGSSFTGRFERFGGEICLDDGEVILVDAWLEPASVDTGMPELDAALQEPEFFDSAVHPRVTFSGSEVRRIGNGEFSVRGALNVKGTARPLEVRFDLAEDARASGELVLDRLRHDIGTGEWSDTDWLRREVTVRFDTSTSPE